MIRNEAETEFVRVPLPPLQRTAEELGRLIIEAIDKSHALSREKQATIESYRVRIDAVGREIAELIAEAKGGPVSRHEDVACEVWYDPEHGDRVLLGTRQNLSEPPFAMESYEVQRRPMTPQECAIAERLAKESA